MFEASRRKKKKTKKSTVNIFITRGCVKFFEQKLQWFDPGKVGFDKFHGLLVEFVRETATNIFGTAPVEPRFP